MKKSVEMLLKKMGEDKAFAEKILSQTEREKVIEIARSEGIELTNEDIDEANEAISKALQLKAEGELSEEELENVAGGSIISAMVVSGIVVSTSAAVVSGFSVATIAGSVAITVPGAIATAITVEASIKNIENYKKDGKL